MNKQSTTKTKLKKIVIVIGGEELALTPEQAKELRDILTDLYGTKTVEHHHYDHWRPWYPYTVTYSTGAILCASDTVTETGDITANNVTDTVRLVAVG